MGYTASDDQLAFLKAEAFQFMDTVQIDQQIAGRQLALIDVQHQVRPAGQIKKGLAVMPGQELADLLQALRADKGFWYVSWHMITSLSGVNLRSRRG